MRPIGEFSWEELARLLAKDLRRVERGLTRTARAETAWTEMGRRIQVLAASVLRRRADAEIGTADLTQEVLLRLHREALMERLASADVPVAYLRTVVQHAALDMARRGSRWAHRNVVADPAAFAQLIDPDSTDRGLTEREQERDSAQRSERLRAALEQLSEVDRAIVTGRFWEGRRTTEIAESLGLTYSAVAVRLHRALRKLRPLIGEEDSPVEPPV